MKEATEKYTYVNHPQNLPLQLNGKSKKRTVSISKEDYNGPKVSIHQESHSIILRKLSNNTHDFGTMKSVLPSEDSKKIIRPNSIKTFKSDKQNILVSGIQYLMQKTENLKTNQQKNRNYYENKANLQIKLPERKHFEQQNTNMKGIMEIQKPHHQKTAERKVNQDLYSNLYRIEEGCKHQKKNEGFNLFKNGQELGFQRKRSKVLSKNKLIEIIGNQHLLKESVFNNKQHKQTRKISNIF